MDIVTTEGGGRVLANLQRKSEQADQMFDALIASMQDAMSVHSDTTYDKPVRVPAWATS